MILSTDDEKIVMDFHREVESFSKVKQLTFLKKKELMMRGNDDLKRPSYHL
tara:strand:+ start:465 stop:617 length:153 start_codon:yes stop_codon:yes gene_type:complete